MIKRKHIQIRDPFIVANIEDKKYYMFGTTDNAPWSHQGVGFDVYISSNLEDFDGPFPVFRPGKDFKGKYHFWAPEVYAYNGKYYMFASFKADNVCRWTQVLVAEEIVGPYKVVENARTPLDWECLDGTLYIDIENNPWMVFCREWIQVKDGEIYAQRLSEDLTMMAGEPIRLFTASTASWSYPNTGPILSNGDSYVTDGPFLFYSKKAELKMLWSSYSQFGYAIGIATSENGSIMGQWLQDKEPLIQSNAGHGMIFETFEGDKILALHQPNDTPNERAIFTQIDI